MVVSQKLTGYFNSQKEKKEQMIKESSKNEEMNESLLRSFTNFAKNLNNGIVFFLELN